MHIQWRVENCRVPVPLGDCSIHPLLRDARTFRACVMDGGTNGKGLKARDVIFTALQKIDEHYGMAWRLTSWVVSHWDADHHEGRRRWTPAKTNTFGSVTQPESLSKSLGTILFLVVGANGFGIGNTIAHQAHTSKNQVSILALLIWPNASCAPHFTGGDGNPEVTLVYVIGWSNMA
ncbi:hypothetical protein CC78DRAFT_539264 [Lojkania enalia]|uniref:Uncharacterized protein n=1 Tax=Lojkania enalia TaxID=147567 RepID=A0A9P4NB56_9PLEO|nr:hypothetical protein CC78DRAFT_539264 [Didymosphaeria enalia]